jgi:hypothetical protein
MIQKLDGMIMTTVTERDVVVDKVRKLLGMIPIARTAGFGFQNFYGLRLVTPTGDHFALSMQGSGSHYCEPREALSTLTQYEAVEVGILPDERSKSERLKLGTKADFGEGVRRPAVKGEKDAFGQEHHGWLMPSDIGFKRLEDSAHDDVLGWVSVNDLVLDLADFFLSGGVIEGDHPETREWMAKVKLNRVPEMTGVGGLSGRLN